MNSFYDLTQAGYSESRLFFALRKSLRRKLGRNKLGRKKLGSCVEMLSRKLASDCLLSWLLPGTGTTFLFLAVPEIFVSPWKHTYVLNSFMYASTSLMTDDLAMKYDFFWLYPSYAGSI